MSSRRITGAIGALCMVAVQFLGAASGLGASTQQPIVAPATMARADRVCEPLGNIVSPDKKWTAFLRRAEWDQPDFAIPYMFTEVWLRERETGRERRVLDYTRLSSKWSCRLERIATTSGVAGGFTFRYMSWSPSSKALALEDAGDEEVSRGLVVIDLEHNRIIEVDGMGLDWSPDGTMAAACSGNMLGCPDGLLVVDLRSGEVSHHFPRMAIEEFGWHSMTALGFKAFREGRMGWWKYEPAKGGAAVGPLAVGSLNVESVQPVQTWWPPESGEHPRCRPGPP
jgi:hypothetical protein